jgi:hypothetical protein
MPYDKAAIDVLKGLRPPPRRWMTHQEATELAKSCGYLIDPPAVGEEGEYERASLLFDLENRAPASIEIWQAKT